MLQQLETTAFMHEQWVKDIHRYIKMSNLLYTKAILKRCDLGLAPARAHTRTRAHVVHMLLAFGS